MTISLGELKFLTFLSSAEGKKFFSVEVMTGLENQKFVERLEGNFNPAIQEETFSPNAPAPILYKITDLGERYINFVLQPDHNAFSLGFGNPKPFNDLKVHYGKIKTAKILEEELLKGLRNNISLDLFRLSPNMKRFVLNHEMGKKNGKASFKFEEFIPIKIDHLGRYSFALYLRAENGKLFHFTDLAWSEKSLRTLNEITNYSDLSQISPRKLKKICRDLGDFLYAAAEKRVKVK